MNQRFPITHYGPSAAAGEIELRSTATRRHWGRLVMPDDGRHWQLEVGQDVYNTMTGDRDRAFFVAVGVAMGGKSG